MCQLCTDMTDRRDYFTLLHAHCRVALLRQWCPDVHTFSSHHLHMYNLLQFKVNGKELEVYKMQGGGGGEVLYQLLVLYQHWFSNHKKKQQQKTTGHALYYTTCTTQNICNRTVQNTFSGLQCTFSIFLTRSRFSSASSIVGTSNSPIDIRERATACCAVRNIQHTMISYIQIIDTDLSNIVGTFKSRVQFLGLDAYSFLSNGIFFNILLYKAVLKCIV